MRFLLSSREAANCFLDEALLLQSEIAKLKQPSKRILDTYREWFNNPRPALGGLSKTFLDDPDDLVGLHSLETDYLSIFLRRYWPFKVRILIHIHEKFTNFVIGRNLSR